MWFMWFLSFTVVVGAVLAWIWRNEEIVRPWDADIAPASWQEALRRYVWYVTLAIAAGMGAGSIMMGAAGRVAMRILAATAGDEAQGRITEADQIVGQISVDESIGFIIFTGLLVGFVTGVLFLLIRRWLPRPPLGGIAFGAFLLVLAATRLDPLRPDNPDFDIVGPGWLAIVIYVAMGVGHGLLVSAIAGRYSRMLPLASRSEGKRMLAYLPLLVLLPGFPLLVAITAAAPIAIAHYAAPRVGLLLTGRPVIRWGRVLLVAVALVALPGFVTGLIDIAGRP